MHGAGRVSTVLPQKHTPIPRVRSAIDRHARHKKPSRAEHGIQPAPPPVPLWPNSLSFHVLRFTRTPAVRREFNGYTFSGDLRPAALSATRVVPPHIRRPDYADHPEGGDCCPEMMIGGGGTGSEAFAPGTVVVCCLLTIIGGIQNQAGKEGHQGLPHMLSLSGVCGLCAHTYCGRRDGCRDPHGGSFVVVVLCRWRPTKPRRSGWLPERILVSPNPSACVLGRGREASRQGLLRRANLGC